MIWWMMSNTPENYTQDRYAHTLHTSHVLFSHLHYCSTAKYENITGEWLVLGACGVSHFGLQPVGYAWVLFEICLLLIYMSLKRQWTWWCSEPMQTGSCIELEACVCMYVCTIFIRIHTHARIHVHSSQSSSKTWNVLCNFCILQLIRGAKCRNNTEIS